MSSPAPPPLPPRNTLMILLAGMTVANLAGGLLLFAVAKLSETYKGPNEGFFMIPSFFLLPLLVGLIAAWFYRRLNRGVGITFLDALWISVVGVGAAAIVLQEGVVCLVIAFPGLYLFILTGLFIGRIWFRWNYTRLQLSVFPLLILLTVTDAFYSSTERAMVTDEILIQTTPDKVWPHVLAFSNIPDRPDYWIFRLGLPYPTQTTNGGNFVGADRQCMFSDGIVIKERVAEIIPNQKLTFDIVEQPAHPEAYGHITLHRGQFVLRDNGNGTTTLFGSSWYTLHVRPLWYFDLWTRDMTRAVHLRVMNHVRRLAEENTL
ncbi:MAG TPA: hypothetical protein VGW39_06020 [Chthoniobacterales bacterium]|nr:hypothetical protein [Chthoniobacterales bacterium]